MVGHAFPSLVFLERLTQFINYWAQIKLVPNLSSPGAMLLNPLQGTSLHACSISTLNDTG